MEPRPDPDRSWRGWQDDGPTSGAVVSARLDGSARTASRLFPKTRSWFALDAPLELLSPISVLRVLVALALVAWPVVGLAVAGGHVHRLAVVVAWALAAVLMVVLLRLGMVGVGGCRLVAAWWTAMVGVLVWSVDGAAPSIAFALFLVPMTVFVALFLGRRAVTWQLAGSLVVLALALVPTEGVARAAGVAAVGTLALAVGPATVLLLGRAARRHDTVDPDTGLVNGFGIAQLASARFGESYLVATVALDGIGHAREAFGYRVGTELLRRAVEDLGQVLPAEATIGRVDGDELVVTLGLDPEGVGTPDPSGAPPAAVDRAGQLLADTLVRAIAAGRYRVGAIVVPLRAHVGLSIAPWDGSGVAELIRRASLSARRASERGVGLVRWDGDQGVLTADDLQLLADLRMAGGRGELWLAYQPQVSAATGELVAVEALLRWDHPDHGAVSPGQFIPLAERTGVIDELTDWVVGEALDAQVRWRRDGLELPVSVNVSARSLTSVELPGWILAQLSDRRLPTSCLTVEVTETAVADPDQALAVLRPLHQQGVRVSIDDFGTGFTSLAALPTLPLDELKVDQSFVLRSPSSPVDEAIVRTVGELAHRIGLQVVAEGVETDETAELLRSMGIDLLQGFGIARPQRESDLVVLAERMRQTPPRVPTTMVVPEAPAGRPRTAV